MGGRKTTVSIGKTLAITDEDGTHGQLLKPSFQRESSADKLGEATCLAAK